MQATAGKFDLGVNCPSEVLLERGAMRCHGYACCRDVAEFRRVMQRSSFAQFIEFRLQLRHASSSSQRAVDVLHHERKSGPGGQETRGRESRNMQGGSQET